MRLKYVDISVHNPLVHDNRIITPRKRSGLNLYKVVVIKSLATGKKYRAQVKCKSDRNLEKKLAILRAIDDLVCDFVKGPVTPFLYEAGQIFENSRSYDEFIDTLKDKLQIKAKILK